MPDITYYSHIPLLSAPPSFLNKVPGLENFLKMARFFGTNVGVYDSSGTHVIPFNYKPTTSMPAFDPDFNLTFLDVIRKRMKELEIKHNATGKNFRLLYSGGVDSTTMFAAFVDYFGMDKTKNILEISCSPESINENPWLWDSYIRPNNFKLISSHTHTRGWGDNVMVVMGEGCDQLFGGYGSGAWCHYALQNKIDIHHDIDQNLLENYLNWYKPGQPVDAVKYCADKLIQIGKNSPFPIDTMYMLVWWYTISVYWDSFSKRILGQSKIDKLPNDILETTLIQFFNTSDFQKWSFKHHYSNLRNYSELENYKLECKNVISSVLNIPEYNVKSKFLSWPRMHSMKKSSYIIDENMVAYNNLEDFLNFVNPNNSFL